MEKVLDPDLSEYLKLFRLQTPTEPISHYEDGELEAKWLAAAGFSNLTKPFKEGREISSAELESVLIGLSVRHAKAIKERVKALNRTVRGRTRSRYKRKPDIRDVFKDVDGSSTGTRSRSATPDSLDSIQGDETWNNAAISIFDTSMPATTKSKQKLRRTPSAPLRGSTELFRGSHVRCDIPFYTSEGIELLAFQRLGTLHIPRIRSGSEPSCSLERQREGQITGSRSHNNLLEDTNSKGDFEVSKKPPLVDTEKLVQIQNEVSEDGSGKLISFENLCKETGESSVIWEEVREPSCDVNDISEADFNKLQPLLWLELAALFDKHNVALDKRKPFKRKRKEEGNLFGISLNALVRRDQQITGEVSSLVPLILQGILDEITRRGAKEEGILRIPGHKQKTESIYNEIESIFYQKPEKVTFILSSASVHDLSALLKRWLRELPQPLLANDLIHLFYQTHQIPPIDQYKAVSILCLLLPDENRNTFRAILSFLNYIIEKQMCNKMTIHNIATIIAPSFFPPRFIYPTDKNNIEAQVKVAAQCYNLTKLLITLNGSLFLVPQRLIHEAKSLKNGQTKAKIKTTNLDKAREMRTTNPEHVNRIVI